MTQNEEILEFLKTGRAITPQEALHKFHCFRLASRISDIRRMGHEVEAKKIAVMNTEGKKVYVCQYRLAE